jgi:hypothetical protein
MSAAAKPTFHKPTLHLNRDLNGHLERKTASPGRVAIGKVRHAARRFHRLLPVTVV